ncbi:pre-mRNA-processing factor 39-like [Pyrgilauda ruficollis]|uniref:pre-mRNA-processing factor 39-like n=1 Tax=Pyrgilauda ruficollis TaxID=221976 RepID=UPI001B85F7A2|nr:pre-mRNA-processing factor 39-like [Pyrgilauda ruficollis]
MAAEGPEQGAGGSGDTEGAMDGDGDSGETAGTGGGEELLEAARRAFDAFLQRYPYCYGYWRKYAELERRLGSARSAQQVLERGLQSIPLSLELWLHYIALLQSSLDPARPDSAQRVRGAFEAALAAAGMDFRSDKLWESYVEWERERGDLRAVTAIYDRLLSMPTQLYSRHWERCVRPGIPRESTGKRRGNTGNSLGKRWGNARNSLGKWWGNARNSLGIHWEFTGKWRGNTRNSLGKQWGNARNSLGKQCEPPDFCVNSPILAVNPPIWEELEQEKIRELVISMRQQIHAQNEAEVSKRWSFEDGYTRYLESRTYTRYLESRTVPGARSVFQRACGSHLPRKPNIHLLWAAFEEKQGNVDEARRILRSFEAAVPGLAMVRLRRVSLERRHGRVAEAEALLLEAMRANEGLPLGSFYAVKLARQVCKVQQNLGKAREVLVEALEKEPVRGDGSEVV